MTDTPKNYMGISDQLSMGIINDNEEKEQEEGEEDEFPSQHDDNYVKSRSSNNNKSNLVTDPHENRKPSLHKPDMVKKSPTSFIDPQDWGLYLRTCCLIRQIHANDHLKAGDQTAMELTLRNKRKNSCLIRMITAFNQLYAEYSTVYDMWKRASLKLEENDSIAIPMSNVTQRGIGMISVVDCAESQENEIKSMNMNPVKDQAFDYPNSEDDKSITNRNQLSRNQSSKSLIGPEQSGVTDPSVTVANTASVSLRCGSSRTIGLPIPDTVGSLSRSFEFTHGVSCFPWCGKPKVFKYPHQSSNNQSSSSVHNQRLWYKQACDDPNDIFYDQIRRDPIEHSLLVHEISSVQPKVEHRTPIYSDDSESGSKTSGVGELNVWMGHEPVTTMRLPIALELILPRMQKQIEDVMKSCQFIYDPLEVACELREVNYDTQACVAYFEKTRNLRDLIEEFLPDSTMDAQSKAGDRCSTITENMATKLRNSVTPSRPSMGPFLIDLITQLGQLRKVNADAYRRLERGRVLVIGMVDKIKQDLLGKIKTASSSTSTLSRLLQGDVPFAHFNQLSEENKMLRLTLRMEETRRKTIFNMMQEYLGNIRVYCRCRLIPNSIQCIQVCSTDTLMLTLGADNATEQFKFDRVFDGNAHQTDIYAELAPSICSFLDGYNVCFLTYGGEASGKTYTLLGNENPDEESHGIVYRSLRTVLTEIEIRESEWKYQLNVAVIEIYNDTLIDLLGDETGIHVRVDLGLNIMMSRLKTMQVDQETDIDQLLNICRTRRRTGRTALNAKSSRSHLIIFIQLCAQNRIYDTQMESVLALCDLAGFEDIIKADTVTDPVLAKEAGYINRSLTALNRLFMTLRSQDPATVSYRDSKLTYLLKPFFTLSGKCILIITVRTDKPNMASTQSSLRFGRESRSVHLGRAKRQLNLDKLLNGIRVT